MPAAFYVAPIDPIPNHLAILGHADDVIVALLAIALFVRLTPAAVRDRLRAGVQPLSADQVVTATLTVLGVTVVAAVTLAWSGFLLWGTIYLFRP